MGNEALCDGGSHTAVEVRRAYASVGEDIEEYTLILWPLLRLPSSLITRLCAIHSRVVFESARLVTASSDSMSIVLNGIEDNACCSSA